MGCRRLMAAGPLRDAPLAVCDVQSIDPDDLVPSDLVYPHRVGETYSVTYNSAHRWYCVPEMRVDQALLIKCSDTKTDGRARSIPHTAFTDPTTPPPTPSRARASSCELWFFIRSKLAR
jgi:hypothetical protein